MGNGDPKIESIKVWDLFVRVFHWSLVGSIMGLYMSGEALKGVHYRLGYFVIILAVARIIWGFIGTKHARFRDFLYRPIEILNYVKSLFVGSPIHYIGHNPAGGLMIVLMLIALLATTFTGLKALATEGQGPLANSNIAILRLVYADGNEHEDEDDEKINSGSLQNEEKEHFWEQMHETMTHFMLFLISIHIAGVLVSSWLHKENLIIAMITGKKKFINLST